MQSKAVYSKKGSKMETNKQADVALSISMIIIKTQLRMI